MSTDSNGGRDRLDQAWCPTCREWTVLDVGKPCAFCETILVRKRGGWKTKSRGRINERMARAIHAKYEAGWSARKLGQELWQVLGYASAHSCEFAIGNAFRRYGLPVRERIEATILASTSSGLSPRDDRERRRRRREAGLVVSGLRAMRPRQPRCAGVKLQAPGKGKPCSKPSLVGSDFCLAHDPSRRAEVVEIVARARERIAA